MNQIQNTYSRPRWRMPDAFPKWVVQYAMAAYVAALVVVSVLYSSYSLPWYYMLSGVVAVTVFFLFGREAVRGLAVNKIRKEKNFEKRLFWIAFIPRLLFMLLIYWLFQTYYGDAFGFDNADATSYDELGRDFATAFNEGKVIATWEEIAKYIDISDMGYGFYVGFVYWLTGEGGIHPVHFLGETATTSALSILTLRLLKCLWSSITVLLIYRLAKRSMSEQTARIAAIFCALWPNFWYYCAVHLKEVEMVFLAILFVEQADQMLRSRQFTAWKIIPVLLIAAVLLTFRTPLAMVAMLALIFSVVMSSTKVVSWGKRIIVGVLAVLLIGVTVGNRIEERSHELLEQVQSGKQQQNMQWRAQREHGNSFAKYASKSVFAPLIFTIPFPTMVRPFEGQEVQQLNNGGNFVKNILSFFTILAMFVLLFSGEWRNHLLPLSFMLGYLVVLTMSAFAQSERFHQPAMAFEFMFAAYGVGVALTKKRYKRWFIYWCVIMFVAAIAWNWFKLAGRGLA